MAIHKVHEVPSELPNARLYLEGIEEISGIILDSYSRRSAGDARIISYIVGDSSADDIHDLESLGGSATNFSIRCGTTECIRLDGFLNPIIRSYSLGDQELWALYGQVKAIFDRRPLKIKNALRSSPKWLLFLLYLALASFPLLLERVLRPLIQARDVKTTVGIALALPWVIFCFVTIYCLFFQSSRVFFVRSHERSKASAAARKSRIVNSVYFVLGSVATKILDLLFTHFLK